MNPGEFFKYVRVIVMELTQEQMATRLGVSQQAVSNMERGVGFPSLEMVTKLAQVAGQDIQISFKGKEPQFSFYGVTPDA